MPVKSIDEWTFECGKCDQNPRKILNPHKKRFIREFAMDVIIKMRNKEKCVSERHWQNVLLATASFFMASYQFLCLCVCARGWHAKCNFTTRKIMVDVVIPCGNLTLSNNNNFDYRHNWKQWPLFKKQQQWIFASAIFIAGLFFEINPYTARENWSLGAT